MEKGQIISTLAAELDAIGDRKQNRLDARVAGQLVVQGINRAQDRLLHGAAAQPSAAEHVVEQNEAIAPDAWQQQLVVSVILCLSGIDKREVEGEPAFELF